MYLNIVFTMLLLTQLIHLVHVIYMYRYRFKSLEDSNLVLMGNEKNSRQQIHDLNSKVTEQDSMIRLLAKDGIDTSAFVISTEGVRVLPKNWREVLAKQVKG